MNLSEELDRSFGEGSPLPPPQDLLLPGRRALTRMRVSVGATAVVIVALIVGSAAVGNSVLGGAPASPGPAVTPSDQATETERAPAPPPTETPKPKDTWPGIPDLDLVRFADRNALVPVDGVDLVQQVARPDLGPSWAGPHDRSAVAEVVHDGERYYVLARDSAGPPQYIAVRAADGGPTLDAFLEMAQDRYAEGGGGLL